MQQREVHILLRKYFEHKANAAEIQQLLDYFDQCKDLDQDVDTLALMERYGREVTLSEIKQTLIFENLKVLLDQDTTTLVIQKRGFTRFLRVAAAVLLIAFSGASWWIIHQSNTAVNRKLSSSNRHAHDLMLPDTGAVVVTAADGASQIIHPTHESKLLAVDDFQFFTTGDGTIICKSTANPNAVDKGLYTDFATLKGQSVRIILPDSSTVWLNANSKLRINHTYNATNRTVALEGEAYFEVKHQVRKPFIVAANTAQIRVLGTAFNVANQRKERKVVTTLVQGAVSLGTPHKQVKLTVGEQAVLDKQDQTIQVKEVNTAAYTSWKDGYFTFNKEKISQLLYRINDWYAIEEIHIPKHLDVEVSGTFERTKKLSDFLRHLEKITDLQFTIAEGRVSVK